MRIRALKLLLSAAICTGVIAGCAQAAVPVASTAGARRATVIATGFNTPTSIVAHDGTLFVGDGGAKLTHAPGGVYIVRNGGAVRLNGSPAYVAGLAWHKNALYVSAGTPHSTTSGLYTIERWSGWNGRSFASRRTIYTAPSTFQSFNGLAFGPDGRLYVGVDAGLMNSNDHGPASLSPYLYDILSMTASGRQFRVYARGIRQPWQMVFPSGSRDPLVSDMGPDDGFDNPPDLLLKVRSGDNYGFPHCDSTCAGYARPWKTFASHTDVMGLAIVGKTLYMTSFLGLQHRGPGQVLSMPVGGGRVRVAATGFSAQTIGLGTDGHKLYIGQEGEQPNTGRIYAVRP